MRRGLLALVALALIGAIAPAGAGHRAWVCSATPSVLVTTSDSCLLQVECPPGPYVCLWSARVEAEGIGLVRGRLQTGTGAPRAQCGAFIFQCADLRSFTSQPGESDLFECVVSGVAIQVRIACSVGVAGHD